MGNWFEWIKDEVREIPAQLFENVKHNVSSAAQTAWDKIRTDVGNAVNQIGAAATSSVAGNVSPAGRQPLTIPLSSGQALAIMAALALLIGFAVYKAVK